MPDTLYEKALAQPFRVGLMLGALTLPTLWVAIKNIWRWLQGLRWLNSEEATQVFAMGFIPGMVLGAGALRALIALRAGEFGQARWLLIGHGGFVALFAGPLLVRDVQQDYLAHQSLSMLPPEILSHYMPIWFYQVLVVVDAVPLQLALAMLLLGLFMRSPNA